MKLYFRNSKGKLRVIAEPTSAKECNAIINQFMDKHGFKNYYMRAWKDSCTGRIIYDMGSHSEFFELDFDQA